MTRKYEEIVEIEILNDIEQVNEYLGSGWELLELCYIEEGIYFLIGATREGLAYYQMSIEEDTEEEIS